MSWAKADDRYDDTSKIKRAWRLSGYAVGLHWMAVTSCARHESDGLIDPEWLAERLGVIPAKAAATALETLVALGLFELLPAGESRTLIDKQGNVITLGPAVEKSYIVHDYLEYQDSAQVLAARRADERQRKAISARARELGLSLSEYRKTADFRLAFPPDSARKADGIQAASEDPDPTRPDPTHIPLAPAQRGDSDSPDPASRMTPKNSRAHGTSPRAVAVREIAEQSKRLAAIAAGALDEPSEDHRAQWQAFRRQLQKAVSESTWGNFLARVDLVAVDGESLVIDAPDDVRSWLPTRFARVIEACAAAVPVAVRAATYDEHEGLKAVAA